MFKLARKNIFSFCFLVFPVLSPKAGLLTFTHPSFTHPSSTDLRQQAQPYDCFLAHPIDAMPSLDLLRAESASAPPHLVVSLVCVADLQALRALESSGTNALQLVLMDDKGAPLKPAPVDLDSMSAKFSLKHTTGKKGLRARLEYTPATSNPGAALPGAWTGERVDVSLLSFSPFFHAVLNSFANGRIIYC